MKKETAQNKEAVKAILNACLYEDAFDLLLDKYVQNFLIRDFEQEVAHPDYDYLKENLRQEMLDKAAQRISEIIELVYKKKS